MLNFPTLETHLVQSFQSCWSANFCLKQNNNIDSLCTVGRYDGKSNFLKSDMERFLTILSSL